MKYVLIGKKSGEVLTYQGRVLVHSSKEELTYLFPNMRVEKFPASCLNSPVLEIQQHPDMQTVRFPLVQNMDQFL